MTYQEAIDKSFTAKWKTGTCSQGEQCWCRTIEPVEPILFEDGDVLSEYYVVRSGEMLKETAEHFVKLHNETFNTNQENLQDSTNGYTYYPQEYKTVFNTKMIEFTDNKKITVNAKPQVVIQSTVRIDGLGTLPVEIIGDFTNIPQQYHELFIQGMLAAYSPLEEAKPKSAITKQKKSYLSWLRAF